MRRLITVLSLVCVAGLWTAGPASAADGGNKPGKGRSEEMRKRMIQRFDKDGDGKLSEDERKAAREAMQEKGAGKRPGQMRPKGRPKVPGKN